VAMADKDQPKRQTQLHAKSLKEMEKRFEVYQSRWAEDGDERRRILERATFDSMIENFKRKTCRLVVLGETHGDPVAHALEFEIFRSLNADTSRDAEKAEMHSSSSLSTSSSSSSSSHSRSCVLSLEMFEVDKQLPLDEYLKGHISEQSMMRDCCVWANYADYRPMIELAKARGIPVYAANAPSRYVSVINSHGEQSSLEQLSDQAKELLPPLPYQMPSAPLLDKVVNFFQANRLRDGQCPAQMNAARKKAFEHMLLAQSLWDASMAWTLAKLLKKGEHPKILHLCGRFHVAHMLGIPEHLDTYLREEHCDKALASMEAPGSAFSAIAKTAVFVPVKFQQDGQPPVIEPSEESLFANLADYVILTEDQTTG